MAKSIKKAAGGITPANEQKVTLSDGREITIVRLKTGDMRKAMNQELLMDKDVYMVSFATGLSVKELDNLEWEDYSLLSSTLAELIKKK